METNNVIYTYIENTKRDDGFETSVLNLWEKTWKNNGWNPVILTREDSEKHPRFIEFFNKVSNIKTRSNSAEYNLLCWLRWLAFSQVGGGIISDYDVINMGLKPEDMIPTNNVRICHSCGVPCLVQSSVEGSNIIISEIINHTPNYLFNNGEWNDMHFFITSNFEKNLNGKTAWLENGSAWNDEYGAHSWEELPVVHFSNNSCNKLGFKNKIQAITKHLNKKVL